jgi:hypothetical protein
MTTNAKAGNALIVGTVATFAMLLTHPTGHDAMATAVAGGAQTANTIAHSLAIAAECLILIGTLGLALALTPHRDVSIGAFGVCALGVVAYLIAGVIGGFIAPNVLARAVNAQGAERDTMMALVNFAGQVQMPFARVGAFLIAVAILVWSTLMVRGRSRSLGAFGLLLGVFAVVGLAVTHGRLAIHGFGGQVMLGQAIWMVWAGARLRRSEA